MATENAYFKTLRSLLAGVDADARCRPSVNPHRHEWVVFTTYVADRWLGVMCLRWGSHGAVQHPSKKEWRRAYKAPSNPYRLAKCGRVRLIRLRPHEWKDEIRLGDNDPNIERICRDCHDAEGPTGAPPIA